MKKKLIVLFLMHLIIILSVYAQVFELTPRIPVQVPSNNSSSVVKKQPRDVNTGSAISSVIRLRSSAAASQISYTWGKYMSTSYSDRLYESVIDASDNVIAVGSIGYSGTDADAIIYKFDHLGNLLWSDQPAKSSNYDGIYGVVTDKIGNIYITGQFYSSAFNSNIYSNGSSDAFIAKYDPDGILLWAKNAGGNDEDYGSNIALDDAGNVYVVGFFNGTAYWDNITKTSSTQGDMFIAKYDNNGNAIWVRNGDIGENNYLYGIGVDKSGNAYVSSKFSGDLYFEGAPTRSSIGGSDVFLIKYDASGNFKWLKIAGGAGDDGGNDTNIDSNGNILIAGYFRDNAQFDTKSLTAHGTIDIFAAKYSPNGNLIWVKQFGGTGSQTAWAINSDEKNNCYLTGWFSGTGAFDNTTILSEGGSDAYIIKYDKNGTLIWVEPTATGLEDQVGSGVFVKANDIAISGYYEGDMNIQESIYPNSGGEDGYLALLTQSNDEQTTVYINPNLSISTAQIKAGQSITFSGIQFSPVGKVDLYFSGTGTINPIIDYAINVSGTFQYTLTTSTFQKSGEYEVTATDKISGKSTSRTFQLIQDQSTVIDDFLKITEPNMSMIRLMGDPIILAWEDKVKFNVNPLFNYKHSYKVEYKRDTNNSSGAWQLFKNIQGTNPGYGNINISTSYTPIDEGLYTFRISDNYYPNRNITTPNIAVGGYVNGDFNIEFKWDKRYSNVIQLSPQGAAADGVSRFYMVVSNMNPLNGGIQKVKVTLSDPQQNESTQTQFLGKVKYCNTQNDNCFTDEANNANSIISEKSISNVDGKYWFWYVAPDDFARNNGDWDFGERKVTATFEITLNDGEIIPAIQKDIIIVRPPLMLVHGLNDYPETWDNFHIGSKNPLYMQDTRFKIIKAVRMGRDSHFGVNASLLLAGIDNENSFMRLIYEMRNKGYACNQLDYVCHSMGGSIFREAVENNNSYLRDDNYGQGFVNKFISLDTPHNGSSFANVLNDVAKAGIFCAPLIALGALNNFYSFDKSVKIVDAIEDLKYKDGIKFNITEVPSHLIGSGVSCNSYNLKTATSYTLLKKYLAMLVPGSDILSSCTWYQIYFNLFGYESDFMEANDGVVSLTSQFSGLSANSLPNYCTRIYGPMHNSTLGDSPMKTPAVWDSVNVLLNKNVNSNLFDSIPATKVLEKRSTKYSPKQKLDIVSDRIKIIYPDTNAVYKAGDTITINLQVDTVGLESFALFFQDQSLFETPATSDVEYRLIVSPEYIERQSIVVLGNYSIADTASISTAKIDIRVNPVGSILDFNVKPDVLMIEKNKTSRPDYEAVFSNSIAQIGQTDSITVSIKDSNVVSYNSSTNQFTGLEKGSTNATVTYKGKSKTVFFEIIQYEEPPVDSITGVNYIEMDKNPQLNVITYPNPFSGNITFKYSLPASGATTLEIYNIYGIKVKAYDFGLQTKGSYSQNVDLKRLADGIYIYKLISGKSIQNGSIVKF